MHGPPPPPPSEPKLSLLAGGAGGAGNADGTGAAASFFGPGGVATDSAGNVYVADGGNSIIRKITPAGDVSTFAGTAGMTGSADGTGAAARFNFPTGIATDSAGDVYVADNSNCTIRKITPTGVVTTLAGMAGETGSADGTGAAARFFLPYGVTTDSGNNVYVADTDNHTIRKITSAGAVSTFVGTAGMSGSADGTGAAARFNYPAGLATDSAGNVYVADSGSIRKITPSGVVTTLAGTGGMSGSTDGTGAAARFNGPEGLAADNAGNVYVADTLNDTIRKITPAGVVTTLAGTAGITGSTDGMGAAARFYTPRGIAIDTAGTLYLTDGGNDTIRKITPTGVVTTMAGTAPTFGSADGTGAGASFDIPTGLATDSAGNVYVADAFDFASSGHGFTIRKITPAGVVTTLAGMAGMIGSADGAGAAARFEGPFGIAADSAGNLYVSDFFNDANYGTASNTIRKITPSGVVSTFAGRPGTIGSTDGTGAAASFAFPAGVATDSAGNVYVADSGNATIRRISPAGAVTTIAGMAGMTGSTDGTGAAALFNNPEGVATDSAGNVYVADTGNNTIRKITPAGVVTTIAGMAGMTGSNDGTGAAARFNYPRGMAADTADNLYVADTYNHTIRKITPAGVVSTIVGRTGESGFVPGPLPGLLTAPNAVALFSTMLYTTTNAAIVQVSNVP